MRITSSPIHVQPARETERLTKAEIDLYQIAESAAAVREHAYVNADGKTLLAECPRFHSDFDQYSGEAAHLASVGQGRRPTRLLGSRADCEEVAAGWGWRGGLFSLGSDKMVSHASE